MVTIDEVRQCLTEQLYTSFLLNLFYSLWKVLYPIHSNTWSTTLNVMGFLLIFLLSGQLICRLIPFSGDGLDIVQMFFQVFYQTLLCIYGVLFLGFYSQIFTYSRLKILNISYFMLKSIFQELLWSLLDELEVHTRHLIPFLPLLSWNEFKLLIILIDVWRSRLEVYM